MIDNILDKLSFVNLEILLEALLVFVAFFISYSSKKFFDRLILTNSKQITLIKDGIIRQKFIKNYRYVSYPLYSALILTFIFIIADYLKLPGTVIVPFTQFALIWFVLRTITAISGSKSPKMIIIIIGVILFLDIFNLTDFVSYSLDKLSIQIGDFKLSSLLVVRLIIALIVSLWVIHLVSQISHKIVAHFSSLNNSAKNITSVIVDIVLYFILLLVVLRVAGVDITTIAVVGSAIGIGIGFGLQRITANFISGLILLFEKSIKEGDVIELSGDYGDIGFVKRMGVRYTLIKTFDNKDIMLPNEVFITNKVTNWTYSGRALRVKIDIGVASNSDLGLVKKLILEAANNHAEKSSNNRPVCFLNGFCSDNAANFVLFVWVKNVNLVQYSKKSDILFDIWESFKKHNIQIAFPKK